MYSIYSDETEFRLSRGKSNYLISEGRGIPSIVMYKKNTHHGVLYILDGKSYFVDKDRLTDKAHMSVSDIMASTSAILGPLVDTRMRLYMKYKILRFPGMFNANMKKFKELAPIVDVAQKKMRFCDGCLWDQHGLASLIIGLQHEKIKRANVILFTTESFAFQEWWMEDRKKHFIYPNCSLFQGKCKQHLKFTKQWKGNAYVNVYKDCVIDKNNSLKSWLTDEIVINLFIVGIHTGYMNFIPFDKNTYRAYDQKIDEYLTEILSEIKIHNFAVTESFGVCFAGGGSRTALLAMKSMCIVNKIRRPDVIAGCSGGGWGITMFYFYRMYPKKFVDILIENATLMMKNKHNKFVLNASRILEAGPVFETFIYILPILGDFRYGWKEIVNKLVFGNSAIPHWNIFPSNVRLVFPTSLLCNSFEN